MKPILLGTLTFIVLSFSPYYGLFSFILILFWYFLDFLLKESNAVEFIKKVGLFSAAVLLWVTVFYSPQLYSNLAFLGNYKRVDLKEDFSQKSVIYRPLEDLYNFSFRPWYFFIPPKESLFFGKLSKNIHKRIESTNYYLANDYMEEEMAGSYMGWHFLLGMGFVAFLLLLKKFKNKEFPIFKSIYNNKGILVRSFFIIFCILLISGPPSFTVTGIEIYTISYLFYYIVPAFRVLVRWSVVIYLFVLIINLYLVLDIYNLMKKTWHKVVFITGFLVLNFVIFAIKIPVLNINKPPLEIAYLKEKFPENVPYAVYPKGDYYSVFWIISDEDVLINPVNFVNYETGFYANEFSKELITQKGIAEFLRYKPKYLIYYKENISEGDLERISGINSDINSKEDISKFFSSYFGSPIFAQNDILIYMVKN
ncbi:MAG: hypothetical protein WC884_03795 [Candidatus Paceibacterota bacterium]